MKSRAARRSFPWAFWLVGGAGLVVGTVVSYTDRDTGAALVIAGIVLAVCLGVILDYRRSTRA